MRSMRPEGAGGSGRRAFASFRLVHRRLVPGLLRLGIRELEAAVRRGGEAGLGRVGEGDPGLVEAAQHFQGDVVADGEGLLEIGDMDVELELEIEARRTEGGKAAADEA